MDKVPAQSWSFPCDKLIHNCVHSIRDRIHPHNLDLADWSNSDLGEILVLSDSSESPESLSLVLVAHQDLVLLVPTGHHRTLRASLTAVLRELGHRPVVPAE